MKLIVGEKIYTSHDQPIMVFLSESDKKNISSMPEGNHFYCEYNDDINEENIKEWISEIRSKIDG